MVENMVEKIELMFSTKDFPTIGFK